MQDKELDDGIKEYQVEGWTRFESTHDGSTLLVFRTVEQELNIALTEEEKANLGADLAGTYNEDAKLEDEKKEFMADWKARKARVQSVRMNKIYAIQSGKEKRIVECDETFDHSQRLHYYAYQHQEFNARPMKEQEFLVGAPTLFDAPLDALPQEPNASEAELVGSTDGNVTKLTGRGKRIQPLGPGMMPPPPPADRELQDVMREERSVRGKVDHVTG